MKSFRFTIWVLIIAVVLFFLWTATLPAELNVRESKTFRAGIPSLYREVSDMNEWENWFPWMDEGMEFTVPGTPKAPGQRLEWSHPEHGKGYMECTGLVRDSVICHNLQFDENSELLLSEFRFIAKQDGSTEIIWTLSYPGKYSYPLGRVRAFAIRKMSSQNMQKGLDDLGKQIQD